MALSQLSTHLTGCLIHIKHAYSSHRSNHATTLLLSQLLQTHRHPSLFSGALCIYPLPQTLITAGMWHDEGGDCVHTVCCGSFSFCSWLFMWLPNLSLTVKHTVHVQGVSTHIDTETISTSKWKDVHTKHTHNPRVCSVGVAAYSQTFIRRQAIREEWTILALHFCQSIYTHIPRRRCKRTHIYPHIYTNRHTKEKHMRVEQT